MVAVAVLVAAAVAALAVWSARHGLAQVPEGSLGVQFFGGAQLDTTLTPGFHWLPPLVSVGIVSVSVQTLTVRAVTCGTHSGVMVSFPAAEVVYRALPGAAAAIVREHTLDFARTLLHDRVHSEMNGLCSSLSLADVAVRRFDEVDDLLAERLRAGLPPGLQLVAVRMSKAVVPDAVRESLERVEALKARRFVVAEQAAVRVKEAETRRRAAVMEAEKALQVARIHAERRVESAASRATIAAVDDSIEHEAVLRRADAALSSALREAEGNRARLTPEYLAWARAARLWRNTAMFVGPDVPDVVWTEGAPGAAVAAPTPDGLHA
jgi:regulator of protease activity HflC (stomatin/prohibitin superfamily)